MIKGYICKLDTVASKELKITIEEYVANNTLQLKFDYSKIKPLSSYNLSDKARLNAWGSTDNAFLPSYTGPASYEWFSFGGVPLKVILALSATFPDTKFYFQAIPTVGVRCLNVSVQGSDVKDSFPISAEERKKLNLMIYLKWKPLLEEGFKPVEVITDPGWEGIQFSF